jgi:hypothetical protein
LAKPMLLVRIIRTACPLHMLKGSIEHGVRAADVDGGATYYTGRKEWLSDIVVGRAKDVIGVNRIIEAYNMTS